MTDHIRPDHVAGPGWDYSRDFGYTPAYTAPLRTEYAGDQPARPRRSGRLPLALAAALVGLLAGVLLSAGLRTAAPSPPASLPVTESTPAACITALDAADSALAAAGQALSITAQAFESISRLDTAALAVANSDLEAVGGRVSTTSSAYRTAAADCRSSR